MPKLLPCRYFDSNDTKVTNTGVSYLKINVKVVSQQQQTVLGQYLNIYAEMVDDRTKKYNTAGLVFRLWPSYGFAPRHFIIPDVLVHASKSSSQEVEAGKAEVQIHL